MIPDNRAQIYGLIVAFLTLPILVYALLSPASDFNNQIIIALVLFTVLTFISEIYEVEFVYKRSVSTGVAFLVAAIALGGLTLAIPAALISTIFAEAFLRGERLKKTPLNFMWIVGFNTGQLVASTFAAGIVYQLLSGQNMLNNMTLETNNFLKFGIFPVMGAYLTFQVVNNLLISIMTTLYMGTNIYYHFRFDAKYLLAQVLSLGVLSVLIAATYAQSPWNLLLILVPMGLVHVSLRNYMKLRHEAKQTFESIAEMLHARDPYTFEHSDEVADLAEEIARQLSLTEDEIDQVRSGALIHDVGKIGIPDSILKKPDRLTQEEWNIMKTHPNIGADLIKNLEMYTDVVDIVRHEHEHWDGQGYPQGLEGDEIPLGARIIAVADAYHALTTDRPYRGAYPHDQAMDIIESESGTHFDPKIVEAFRQVVADKWSPCSGSDMTTSEPNSSSPSN